MEGFDWTAGGLILIYRYLQEWYIVDYGNGLIVESNAGPHSNSSILIVFLCQATVQCTWAGSLFLYYKKIIFSYEVSALETSGVETCSKALALRADIVLSAYSR